VAEKKLKPLIYMARTSFVRGSRVIRRGDSVPAGHPLMKGRETMFVPFQPTHGSLNWSDPEAPAPEPTPAPTPAPDPDPSPDPAGTAEGDTDPATAGDGAPADAGDA
jgi:hypothetical protein